MTRFLVFTVLFPPLVLVVYCAPDPIFARGLMQPEFLLWILAGTYMIAVVPAWLTAIVDGALTKRPTFFRLAATMVTAAVLALITARYGFAQNGNFIYFASMGAIPAILCSVVSHQLTEQAQASTNTRERI